jgi:signal transduction histidine kinase
MTTPDSPSTLEVTIVPHGRLTMVGTDLIGAPPLRENRLAHALVELADALVADFDVVELLTRLTDRCISVLDVNAAGIMLARPDGDLRVMASSGEAMRLLELFEIQSEEGPCLDCFRTGRPVINQDLDGVERQWPRFASTARDAGFASVHALPMRLRGTVIGALNLFHATPGRLHQADIAAGQALADIATIAILQHRAAIEGQTLKSQLSNVLNTQIVIEQAKGMLAERKSIDLDQSFRVLRNHSRNHNLRLADVAEAIVAGTLGDAALDPLSTESEASRRPSDTVPTMTPSTRSEESAALELSDRLRTLLTAAVELVGPQDPGVLLQRIVEDAATVTHARYCALGVYGDDGRTTTFVHYGVDDATVERIAHVPEGRGLLGEVIVGADPFRLEDLGSDQHASGFPPGHPPMRSFLGVPVVRRGRRLGNLYVTEKHRGEPFDDEDEVLVVALAAFAAAALERAELVEVEHDRAEAVAEQVGAVEQARARRELLAHTIAAQEAERARVSRDLHDDVGQALTSVLLGLRLVEDSLNAPTVDLDDVRGRSTGLRELIADALRRARQLAFDLRPTVLDDVGLAPALERLSAVVARRAGLRVELAITLPPDERLAPETETVVYRVVQEALTNVVRHAQASTVSIAVTGFGERVRAHVEDDGIGFDPSSRPARGHLGLIGMEERAHLVGGTIAVSSRPGEGTTVLVEVPRG